jgi:rhodanese-related sulfurtransferase
MTYVSTETRQMTISVVDVRTDEEVFVMHVPPGKQLTMDFRRDGGDDPVVTPDLMRWELFDAGRRTGRLHNALTVPNAASRRIDVFVHQGVEWQTAPPEQRLRTDELAERLALQVLHHQKHQAVAGLAEVGDVDDVLVIDAIGRPRLAQEALTGCRVTREARGQELERYVAPHQLVPSPIHGAHAAGADELRHHVAAPDGAPHERIGDLFESCTVEGTDARV